MPLTLAYEAAPAPRRASTGPTLAFDAAARVAEPRDNCAIATSDLAQGTTLQLPNGTSLTLSVGVLEGHRFALVPIAAGALLLRQPRRPGRRLEFPRLERARGGGRVRGGEQGHAGGGAVQAWRSALPSILFLIKSQCIFLMLSYVLGLNSWQYILLYEIKN